MFGLSPAELLVVGIVALIIFGNRLPEVARSLGKGVVEFRKGLRGIEEDIHSTDSPSSKSNELAHTTQEKVNVSTKEHSQQPADSLQHQKATISSDNESHS